MSLASLSLSPTSRRHYVDDDEEATTDSLNSESNHNGTKKPCKIKAMTHKLFKCNNTQSSQSQQTSNTNNNNNQHQQHHQAQGTNTTANTNDSSNSSLETPPFTTAILSEREDEELESWYLQQQQQQQQQIETTERMDNRSTVSLPPPTVTPAFASAVVSQQQQHHQRLPMRGGGTNQTAVAVRQTTGGTTLTDTTSFSSIVSSGSSHNGISPHLETPNTTSSNMANNTRHIRSNNNNQITTSLDSSNSTSNSTPLPPTNTTTSTSTSLSLSKQRKINLLIDQCESTRFIVSPFTSKNRRSKKKKSLILSNMNLTSTEVPIQEILTTGTLSTTLSNLSLSGNCLISIPELLVVELKGLKMLDISQCELRGLPGKWDLPVLKRLNLGHNKICEFPSEKMLLGIPELQHLDMYGNKICTINISTTTAKTTQQEQPLSHLESLNLGYNRLSALPPSLSTLPALKSLKVQNNMIEKIPVQVCEMDLRIIDVSSNPLIQPPVETCERGISSMRRYYSCLRLEETQQRRIMDAAAAQASQPTPIKKVVILENYEQQQQQPKLQFRICKKWGSSMKRSQTLGAAPSKFSASAPTPNLTATAARLTPNEMSRARSVPATAFNSYSSSYSSSQQQQQQQQAMMVASRQRSQGILEQNNDRIIQNIQQQQQQQQKGGGVRATSPDIFMSPRSANSVKSNYMQYKSTGEFPSPQQMQQSRGGSSISSSKGELFKRVALTSSSPPDSPIAAGSSGPMMARGMNLKPAVMVTQGPSATTTVPPPHNTAIHTENSMMRHRQPQSQYPQPQSVHHLRRMPPLTKQQQQQQQHQPVLPIPTPQAIRSTSPVTISKTLEHEVIPINRSIPTKVSPPPIITQQQQPLSPSSSTQAPSPIAETSSIPTPSPSSEQITCNDTLKVIFVGMAYSGKTSMIKRLIDGPYAKIPKRDERTVGVDIYEWDPAAAAEIGEGDETEEWRKRVDTRIVMEGEDCECECEETNVKFSVWDFAGQHEYHATHELFFSQRALYVLVWDMGATNNDTQKRIFSTHDENDQGAFKLTYDSSDDEDEEDFITDDEVRRADRALERDIDEKVQFWVDCIQSSAPGAAILPVASHDDFFESSDGYSPDEAKRRCNLLKSRLLHHEERRIRGLQQRLEKYEKDNRANADAALRLRKLLCPFSRPKLIFGGGSNSSSLSSSSNFEEDSVVRVSCTNYTGFDRLSEKLVHIATGRDRAGWDYPIFRGHVGARIPRMRLQVRDVVRNMRDRFKVVEWGFFLSALREQGLDNVDDVSDALHFLTNVGELSYFGDVVQDVHEVMRREPDHGEAKEGENGCNGVGIDDDDDDESVLTIEKYREDVYEQPLPKDDSHKPMNGDPSSSSTETQSSSGLSQFVFLNPRWLVAAVACILRHNLTWKIHEIKRELRKHRIKKGESGLFRSENFYENNKNYPVITAEDACMLWQAEKFTKKAAERAIQYSNNVTLTPFAFLQRLLIRFGVFVPIDLSIDKACLGGREYGRTCCIEETGLDNIPLPQVNVSSGEETPRFFFLPSLLGPGEPSEVWTYKTSDSWKTTICNSILFPDGVPPGLMERITAAVLSDIYSATQNVKRNHNPTPAGEISEPVAQSLNRTTNQHRTGSEENKLHIREILCWRAAFFVKIGMENVFSDGETRESIVEIFCHLVDRENRLCVASESMGVGMRRLILSAKGQVGDGGKKIWDGGHKIVIRAIGRVMHEYGGLEFDKQSICPECLQKKPVSQASVWDWTQTWSAIKNGNKTMRCQNGHSVDTVLLTGYCDQQQTPNSSAQSKVEDGEPIVPVTDLLGAVVLVGLWDERSKKVLRAGSGFIVDKKRGLIVTASHTLMNIWGEEGSPFGEDYFGSRHGKVVIGVIPKTGDGNSLDGTTTVFRYFAKILAKDSSIEKKGVCHMDACILAITTRMEEDIGGDGDGCGDQPEILLLNDPDAMKREKLQQLKVTVNCELEEKVRILGYNQGGEGLRGHGEHLNRTVDFARGYVVMKFATDEDGEGSIRQKFKPREEIVVMCYTIGGHSGGPCVNQQGEVIGILSRADPAEKHRCYLVPASEWKPLVKKAKKLSLF